MWWLIALDDKKVATQESDNWSASLLQKGKQEEEHSEYLFVDLAKHPDRHSYYVSSIG